MSRLAQQTTIDTIVRCVDVCRERNSGGNGGKNVVGELLVVYEVESQKTTAPVAGGKHFT